MKGKRSKAAAVVLAISGMAGQACAETVCAGAQDLTALQVASVQQQLMVAALSCEVDDVTLYNSFVGVYQQELVTSDEALQAYFLRRAPGTGTDDYNSFKTRLANNFSLSSGGDRPSFCRRADRLFHDALAGRKKSLAAFVLAQPMIVDADYTVCGDTVKGESFAYTAVKEEPKDEKPVAAEPVLAPAPPPKIEPQAPVVVRAREDANTRNYAENLPAAAPQPAAPTPNYQYQAQPATQSTCSRMSNGYLDCYYGDFHYYRDPYGRYLPPPPAYRRRY
jgi:hypothetical protein